MRDDDLTVPIRVLHDITARFETLEIPYMLTGSMALFHYAVYRMTADIDVVLELKERRAQLLIDNLEPDYYVPHNSMRRAIEAQRMFNVLHQGTAFKVDCVLRKSTPFHKAAFDRRKTEDFYGRPVYIITAEDLVISKLEWAADSRSEKQLTDVKNLLRNELDIEYIKSWTTKMDLDDLFQEIKSAIEQ
jgi:hypothetical protein